jgi:hypothetical protein
MELPEGTRSRPFARSNYASASMIELIGAAKTILLVGAVNSYSRLLSEKGHDIIGVVPSPSNLDDVRGFCSSVEVADLNNSTLTEVVGDLRFDVAVFNGILDRVQHPWQLLSDARYLLRRQGFVVAVLPNVYQSPIGLALVNRDPVAANGGTENLDEFFIRAGFRVEVIRRINELQVQDNGQAEMPLVVKATPTSDAAITSRGMASARPSSFGTDEGSAGQRTASTIEVLQATQSALCESREQIAALSAEIALLKVRSVQAEIRAEQSAGSAELHSALLEREDQVREGAIYVAHLEQEIADAKAWGDTEAIRANDAASSASQYADALETLREEFVSIKAELENTLTTRDALEQELEAAGLALSSAREQLVALQLAHVRASENIQESLGIAEELRTLAERNAEQAELARLDAVVKAQAVERELEVVRDAALADKIVQNEYVHDARRRLQQAEGIIAEGTRYATHLEEEVGLAKSWAHQAEERAESARASCDRLISELHAERRHTQEEVLARRVLEQQCDSLRRDSESLRRDAEALRRESEALRHEIATQNVQRELLQGKLTEAEHRLVVQTEEMVATVQAERKQLATLIDTVQSSHFWKLKHWLKSLKLQIVGR